MSLEQQIYYKQNKSSNGVRYIKVSKFDKNGQDNSNRLRNLSKFTVTYNDQDPGSTIYSFNTASNNGTGSLESSSISQSIHYPIIGKVEYTNYFLFTIDNENYDTTFTSSVGDYKK